MAYYTSTHDLAFNTPTSGYIDSNFPAGIWITDGVMQRIILIDDNGNILKTIDALNNTTIGADYEVYEKCGIALIFLKCPI
ncbi:MAG: hypothetical protein IT292_07990 [Deltaproteobacteria bacterium]|nr:hypothetical protein [Deltaproteobacteria bacterium]